MFRFAFPIITLISIVLLVIAVYVIYRMIKSTTKTVIEKGSEVVSEQQQKWNEREKRKGMPNIYHRGYAQHQQTRSLLKQLTPGWQKSVRPIVRQGDEILRQLMDQPEKIDQMRDFFNHSLDALHQFVVGLAKNKRAMTRTETDKARANIKLLKTDFSCHNKKIDNQNAFDFDVLMDVIKARLKK